MYSPTLKNDKFSSFILRCCIPPLLYKEISTKLKKWKTPKFLNIHLRLILPSTFLKKLNVLLKNEKHKR